MREMTRLTPSRVLDMFLHPWRLLVRKVHYGFERGGLSFKYVLMKARARPLILCSTLFGLINYLGNLSSRVNTLYESLDRESCVINSGKIHGT